MKTPTVSNGAVDVYSFFDPFTYTVSHIVVDPKTNKAAVIDSVMDYEPKGASISFESADRMIDFIKENGFEVEWVLETHAHADHLSAAPYVQEKLGGKIAIGEKIKVVQNVFGKIFNEGTDFARDASQFGRLFKDGDTFKLGLVDVRVMHTPGHTPADITYIVGDAAFVGDTLFMPDFGTARCDFPGGSAHKLYDSIQQIFELDDDMRLFMCHDYLPDNRDEYAWETTVKEERERNVHVGDGADKESFVEMRESRDETLDMPRLIIQSIQVNMRAGNLPEPEDNGTSYLKTPINSLE